MGPVALGLVVALAPSCRQLAGIHVVESQQAACSTCVDASCGPQSSTCLATASCATRLECALACDPTDGTCVPGCQAQPVGDADDLGAVEACIAKSCGSACELTWGGILPRSLLQRRPPARRVSARSALLPIRRARRARTVPPGSNALDRTRPPTPCRRASWVIPPRRRSTQRSRPASRRAAPRRARSGPTGRASVRSRGRSLRPTPWSAR